MRSGVEDEEKRSKWTSHFDSVWESPYLDNLINVWPRFHSSSALCPHRLPPSSTSGLIAWSAFEADKFCLYDFVSSSAIWPSDYESDYGLPTSTPRPHPSSTNDFSTTSSSPTLVSTASTGLIACTVWLSDYESDASTLRHYLFVLCASACPATQFYFIVCGNFERSTSLYSNYRSIIKVWGMQNMVGTLARIIPGLLRAEKLIFAPSPIWTLIFLPCFNIRESTPFLSIKPAYVSMAPSTRNAARRGATGTGTHDPTVSGTYVMRTRSGVAINPPAKQNNKRQRNAVPESSPAPDDPHRPKPRPLPRRSSGTTFEDYARILARPRKQHLKPTADSVSSGMELQSDHPPDTPDIDDDVPVTDTRMDDDMNGGAANEDEDEDNDGSKVIATTTPRMAMKSLRVAMKSLRGGDEEPEGGENNKDFETSQETSASKGQEGQLQFTFDDGSQSSSSDTSYREGPPRKIDQDSAHESDANKDLDPKPQQPVFTAC
ncbi:hypothetical protein DFJ58DRAFT_735270 [Suillus subalutaceus]|uniref:uncharacterized protein n=1 Tax=Suillus subalutaceus TaxID=48586 RepID=UPI001B864C49|nr:uncharacterized protein DFJ58DRAFT_735270 [Suillus subalutaceus]KAG1836058.1 hypothetical protein DFJ58DRAFT_735270 [Suillus subalutaceus]